MTLERRLRHSRSFSGGPMRRQDDARTERGPMNRRCSCHWRSLEKSVKKLRFAGLAGFAFLSCPNEESLKKLRSAGLAGFAFFVVSGNQGRSKRAAVLARKAFQFLTSSSIESA